jgi:hypothetical protein
MKSVTGSQSLCEETGAARPVFSRGIMTCLTRHVTIRRPTHWFERLRGNNRRAECVAEDSIISG